jgi:transposase InsO family protein
LRITDAQVRKLHEEVNMGKAITQAALRAGLHRNTATKYLQSGLMPSESRKPRTWRTRENPFEEDWAGILEMLDAAPELEVKTIFESLLERKPEQYHEGQLRTLQRQVRAWRARHGPPKELFFAQAHRPGEAAQTDFTHVSELGITIGGEPYPHLLCHVALPYSNWSWATACRSESLPALREGTQTAFFKLGRVPKYHQTDNTSAATHDVPSGKREFNQEYLDLVEHLGMKPRTIGVGECHQNGDVEALNGALKRSLRQHLLLRGSSDFESRAVYVAWLETVLEKRNRLRSRRLKEELAVMSKLPGHRLPAYSVIETRVGSGATFRARGNTYSVPSRLRGERVRVHAYDDRLEIYHGGAHQLTVERLRGSGGACIQYRHVIESLVRKPGAFRRYRHFDALFPTAVFREAFEVLDASLSYWKANVHYLRVLRLAARTMESEVEAALREILDAGEIPEFEAVEVRVAPREPVVPEVEIPAVTLDGYDDLLESSGPEVAA